MGKYREYSLEELNLESQIKEEIQNKRYSSAILLTYSAIEYMVKQIILMNSKQVTPEMYNTINRIQLRQAILFLYYGGLVSIDVLNETDKLIDKRNDYTHDFIRKHLARKKDNLDSYCVLYSNIFSLYKKNIESK